MQTPWSHPAVRTEFDEEIRLLITAMTHTPTDALSEDDAQAAGCQVVERAHLASLWCSAALYAPWTLTPMDTGQITSQAGQLYHCLRSTEILHDEAGRATRARQAEASCARKLSAREALALIEASAHATLLGIEGAAEDLLSLLSEHERRHWDPRYGLLGSTREDHGYELATNVAAIGIYILAAEVTGERLWADRARAVASALARSLPVGALPLRATTITEGGDCLPTSADEGNNADPAADTVQRGRGATSSAALVAPISPASHSGVYFTWVRQLLFLRAHLVEAGDEAPEWLLTSAWGIYRWAMKASWKGEEEGFSPVISPLATFASTGVVATDDALECPPAFCPLAEAVSAAEALGKTLEYAGGRDEWLTQLSADFATAMTWADLHLRRGPGQWEARKGQEASTSPATGWEMLHHRHGMLYGLLPPLMLARLPLAPSIASALKHGHLAPVFIYLD
ncbi:hypothetical protein [Schaalia sp. Marseille-Q2122]|uniref:hypothetical protein n=1 Tax=Schaalia sp. Marseille-Q2122 TaxID=2736604 RepID=UPI00158CE52D|nr:hypothetical protein [Schaalia sp. Marseille-Q2122]